jgi:hypothetical protein
VFPASTRWARDIQRYRLEIAMLMVMSRARKVDEMEKPSTLAEIGTINLRGMEVK